MSIHELEIFDNRTGVSQSTPSSWEQGRNPIRSETEDLLEHKISVARFTHNQLMQTLSERVQTLVRRELGNRAVAYVDYPVHANIGDQLINLGTEVFFARSRMEVIGRWSMHDLFTFNNQDGSFCREKAALRELDTIAERDVPIVLHGGGNFGDLYPHFNEMRLRILDRYPENLVVMLPQSVHFNDAACEASTLRSMVRHKHFVAYVRDRESFDRLSEAGLKCLLAPDMAHTLWGQLSRDFHPRSEMNPLILLRRDRESVLKGLEQWSAGVDWDAIRTGSDHLFLRWFTRLQKWNNLPRVRLVLQRIWYRYRDALVQKALNLFSPASEICTDRLHAMLLACLLGKRVKFFDNSYGKLARYHRDWLSDSEMISQVQWGCGVTK